MVKKTFLFSILAVTLLLALVYILFYKSYNGKTIVLGSSLPLSGINKDLGREIIEGANSYFSHINAKGGIHGKHIKYVYYDDKYEPQNTLTNIHTLIEKDKAFALFSFVGTPTAKLVLPIVLDTGIPFIAPYTGASFLRNLDIPNIVNFRSSYAQEIEKIVSYLYTTKKLTKFAIFYQNDDYGEEGYIALVQALQKRKLSLIGEGTYKRNTLSISHALNEIKSTNPEAVIIVGAYKPSARFIKKVRECCLEGVIFAPISFVNADALMRELEGNGTNILFSQTVPSFDDTSLKAASEYLKLLKFYYPKSQPTHVSFEAFLAAKSVVEALKKVQGPLRTGKFLDNLKALDKSTLDDIPLEYKDSQLLNRVFLLSYKNGKFNTINKKEN